MSQLSTSSPEWNNVKDAADAPLPHPDLQDGEQSSNVQVLAKALVYARTGDEAYRDQVVAACHGVIGTEDGRLPGRGSNWQTVRTLGPARELMAYVLAADLVGLPVDLDQRFRAWLHELLGKNLGGRTLRSTHEDRPNNWGTHAGASRLAVALYLNDQAELQRAMLVFRGWLGDLSAYNSFSFGTLDWQADPNQPVGINPMGATKNGNPIDGVLPDDQRRGGGFVWPPPHENYVYEALQGALAQAVLLDRAGYPDVWDWQDQALLRAYRWLYASCNYAATGDDRCQLPLVDYFYGTSYADGKPTKPAKNFGWTCWTHGGRSAGH